MLKMAYATASSTNLQEQMQPDHLDNTNQDEMYRHVSSCTHSTLTVALQKGLAPSTTLPG